MLYNVWNDVLFVFIERFKKPWTLILKQSSYYRELHYVIFNVKTRLIDHNFKYRNVIKYYQLVAHVSIHLAWIKKILIYYLFESLQTNKEGNFWILLGETIRLIFYLTINLMKVNIWIRIPTDTHRC